MLIGLAKRSRTTKLGFALVLALVGLFFQPQFPIVARRQDQTTLSIRRAKFERTVLTGQQASEFLSAQAFRNPKIRQRSENPRVLNSPNFVNLTVVSIRRKPANRTKTVMARFADMFFGSRAVEAAGSEDCDGWLSETNSQPSAQVVVRKVAMDVGCENIEEVNVYEDYFESNVQTAGSLGLMTAVEVLGDGISGYVESQVEINMPLVDRGNDTVGIDLNWIDELSDAIDQGAAELATFLQQFNWVFNMFGDEGYGSTDEFAESGIPCNQTEYIFSYIMMTSLKTALSGGLIAMAAVTAAAVCLPTVITYWGWIVCIAGGTVVGIGQNFRSLVSYQTMLFLLDCVFDFTAPSPSAFESGWSLSTPPARATWHP